MGKKIKSIFIGKITGSRNKTIGAIFYEINTGKQRNVSKDSLPEYFKHMEVVNCSYTEKGCFRSTWEGYVISKYSVYDRSRNVTKHGYDLKALYRKAVTELRINNTKSVYSKDNVNIEAAGALWHNASDIITQKKMQEHAKRYYEHIRNSKPYGIERIAKRADVSAEDILRVRKYLFIDKHNLGEYGIKRFAPDYYIAESWRRLASSKNEYIAADVTLIRHELAESSYIEQGFSHNEAHRLAEKRFDYVCDFEKCTGVKVQGGIYDE